MIKPMTVEELNSLNPSWHNPVRLERIYQSGDGFDNMTAISPVVGEVFASLYYKGELELVSIYRLWEYRSHKK